MTTRTIEDYDLLDPGTYDATAVGIEEGDDGQYGPTVRFNFEAMGPDGPVDVDALASDVWKGATKARAWFSVLVGHTLAKDERIDWDDVKGRPCQITVTHVVDRKGITRARIADVLPPRKARSAPAEAADDLPF
jgi:hypothetical protein